MKMQAPRSVEQWDRDTQRNDTDRERRLRTTGIPPQYLEMTWGDYDEATAVTDKDESLKEVLRTWATWMTAQIAAEAPLEGLVLLGPPGRGKTQGAALAAREIALAGGWVKWSTYAGLVEREKEIIRLSRIADQTGNYDEVSRQEYLRDFTVKECDLLVLDDVGKEYRAKSGFGDAGLDRILRDRTAAQKATLLTSNLLLEEWLQYNDSMSSFLHEVGEVVTITGGRDRRSKRRARWRG